MRSENLKDDRSIEKLGLPPMALAESSSDGHHSNGIIKYFYSVIQKITKLLLLTAFGIGIYILLLKFFDNTGSGTEVLLVTVNPESPNDTFHNIDMFLQLKNKTDLETNRKKRQAVLPLGTTVEAEDLFQNFNDEDLQKARELIMRHDMECSDDTKQEICKDLVLKLRTLGENSRSMQERISKDSARTFDSSDALIKNGLIIPDVSKRETLPITNLDDIIETIPTFDGRDVGPYVNQPFIPHQPSAVVQPLSENCLLARLLKHNQLRAHDIYQPLPEQIAAQSLVPQNSYLSPVLHPYLQARETDFRRRIHPQDVEIFLSMLTEKPQTSTKKSENLTGREIECPEGSLSCITNDLCIDEKLWCDGIVNCPDVSDEMQCSCKSRVDKARLCDGYFDCPFGEDEMGCFGCDENTFSCDDPDINSRNTCFTKEQRCNNVVDCPNQKDEVECNMLAPSLLRKPMFAISNTEGYLHRNFKGDWYSVCKNPYMWAHDTCRRETGLLIRPPYIQIVPIDPTLKINYLNTGPGGLLQTSDTCMNSSAVYVTCPDLLCGTRVQSTSQLLRENADIENNLFGRNKRFLLSNHPYPLMLHGNRMKRNVDDTSIKTDYDNKFGKFKEDPFDEKRDKRAESRVVGGKPSQPAAWPWMVAVYRNGMFHCGGVIITHSWIVSAAHCVKIYWEYYYEVRVGMLRRFSFSPQEQSHLVSHIIVNQHYSQRDMRNDLSLLKVEPAVQFSRWVRPICLPGPDTAGDDWLWGPSPGTLCVAVGWGATREHGPDPDHMREVEVPIWEKCKHREDRSGKEICAGRFEGGKDACQGDSGGPLLCKNPLNSQQWYMAGIVSHGDGCGRKGEPGVYTRVSLFIEWIKFHISSKSLPMVQPIQICTGFKCKSGISKCLHKKRKCDLFVDCLDGEDEMDCDFTIKAAEDVNSDSILFAKTPESVTTEESTTTENEDNYLFNTEINLTDNILDTHTEISTTINSIFSTTNDISTTTDNISTTTDNISTTTDNISTTTDNISTTTDNISTTTDDISTTTDNTSTTTDNTSTTIDNTSTTTDITTTTDNITTKTYECSNQYSEENFTNSQNCSSNKIGTVEHKTQTTLFDFTNASTIEIASPTSEELFENYSDKQVIVDPMKTTNSSFNSENQKEGETILTNKSSDDNLESGSSDVEERKTNKSNKRRHKKKNKLGPRRKKTKVLPETTIRYNLLEDELLSDKYMYKYYKNFTAIEKSKQRSDQLLIELLPSIKDFSNETSIKTKPEHIEDKFHKNKQISASDKYTTASEKPKKLTDFENNSDVVNKIQNIMTSELQPAKVRRKHLVPKEFECRRIYQVIPYNHRCDGKADCEDGTDELSCTCIDYLSTFNHNLLCDGMFDCADGQDEIDCYSCPEDKFLCKQSKICLPMKHVCDGKQHCPHHEDELDCFALTNGKEIVFDIDQRPKINLDGYLTRKHSKDWHVVCDDNLSIEQQEQAATHVCRYLGFSSANRYYVKYINIKGDEIAETNLNNIRHKRNTKESLPIHFAYKKTGEDFNNTSKEIIIKDPQVVKEHCVPNITKTCKSLYVYCDQSLFTNFGDIQNIFLRDSNNVSYQIWPWSAKVYVEGEYKCTGILVNLSWVLVSDACLWESTSSNYYITVVLGSPRTISSINGMYEQMYPVDATRNIYRSKTVLLHLKYPAHYSNLVKPMVISSSFSHLDYQWNCVALGQDNNNNTLSVFLEETSRNCHPSNRCFIRITKENICPAGVTINRKWAGLVSCHTDQGWVPVASFVDSRGECGTIDYIRGTDIENLRNEIKYYSTISLHTAIEQDKEDDCEGERCGRGRCIPLLDTCDGVRHCEDGNDESEQACEKKASICSKDPYHRGCECSVGQMKCRNGKCISKELFNDGSNDCGDGTDEPTENNCFDYLSRVMPSRLCDGVLHCHDRSDEDPMFCKCFAKNVFKCGTKSGNAEHCVAPDVVCDGTRDCPNGEDEQTCIGLHALEGTPFGTGQVIVRSHGVWRSKCYPTQNHTKSELEEICREVGFNSGHAKEIKELEKLAIHPHNDLVISPFSNVVLNNNTMIKLRNTQEPIAKPVFDHTLKNCYPVFIECL